MKIAKKYSCFGTGNNQNDKHQKQETKHVIHLVGPVIKHVRTQWYKYFDTINDILFILLSTRKGFLFFLSQQIKQGNFFWWRRGLRQGRIRWWCRHILASCWGRPWNYYSGKYSNPVYLLVESEVLKKKNTMERQFKVGKKPN